MSSPNRLRGWRMRGMLFCDRPALRRGRSARRRPGTDRAVRPGKRARSRSLPRFVRRRALHCRWTCCRRVFPDLDNDGHYRQLLPVRSCRGGRPCRKSARAMPGPGRTGADHGFAELRRVQRRRPCHRLRAGRGRAGCRLAAAGPRRGRGDVRPDRSRRRADDRTRLRASARAWPRRLSSIRTSTRGRASDVPALYAGLRRAACRSMLAGPIRSVTRRRLPRARTCASARTDRGPSACHQAWRLCRRRAGGHRG